MTDGPAASRWLTAAAALGRRAPVRSWGALPLAAGAGLVVATAAIHLHLYLIGYRHVPTLGVLFMLQAVTGFALAAVLLAGRQAALAVVGAGYMAASAVGLILSATVGFVGVHDSLSAPWATPSLVVELIGMVLLAGAAALAARPGRRVQPPAPASAAGHGPDHVEGLGAGGHRPGQRGVRRVVG